MKREKIYDGITGIREDLIEKAEHYKFKGEQALNEEADIINMDRKAKRSGRTPWMKWMATAACQCLYCAISAERPGMGRHRKVAAEPPERYL